MLGKMLSDLDCQTWKSAVKSRGGIEKLQNGNWCQVIRPSWYELEDQIWWGCLARLVVKLNLAMLVFLFFFGGMFLALWSGLGLIAQSNIEEGWVSKLISFCHINILSSFPGRKAEALSGWKTPIRKKTFSITWRTTLKMWQIPMRMDVNIPEFLEELPEADICENINQGRLISWCNDESNNKALILEAIT